MQSADMETLSLEGVLFALMHGGPGVAHTLREIDASKVEATLEHALALFDMDAGDDTCAALEIAPAMFDEVKQLQDGAITSTLERPLS
jgi:hypothetical protein